MGGAHVQLAISRAQRLGVGIDTRIPRVPYKETITRAAEATYRHKKQTGGAGQFAEVTLSVEPAPGEGYIHENNIFGGAISQQFQSSIEKGITQLLPEGVIAGYRLWT